MQENVSFPHVSIFSCLAVPSLKFARNVGVDSVAWLEIGSLLAVGTAVRNMHLYDVRFRGTNSPPISVAAHTDAISGIVPNPSRPNIFATFCSAVCQGEAPVKLWDVRKMSRSVVEIKIPYEKAVKAVEWNAYTTGTLCVAAGDTILFYETLGAAGTEDTLAVRPILSESVVVDNGSVADPTESDDAKNEVQAIAFPISADIIKDNHGTSNQDKLYPKRMLIVSHSGQVSNMPTEYVAPLEVSSRDGRIVHSCGRTSVCMSKTNEGPSALESAIVKPTEDISATMMRRARCSNPVRYSTDPISNQLMLKNEDLKLPPKFEGFRLNSERLRRVWSWIERIETLSNDQRDDFHAEGILWPAKGLSDAGVYKLLRLDISDDKLIPNSPKTARGTRVTKQQRYWSQDTEHVDASLGCKVFDSPLRR